ncbi:SLBB domain-containing protein [Carboxylicivirga sp. A043]|uniref:SLBB domain-containing protein n=1 Tax=Carboxylicivirga litoralis TaxID=2816963 RepID=UPI0021CB8472|nr:SLBB domain-containing protein [Carboxylicivirga sp. A043]MCU4157546.1 SLBB domain-containing protein [Carboxylicivirga sp. A043]
MRLGCLLFFLVIALSALNVQAQSIDPNSVDVKSVNVDDLSDAQIMRMIQEMEKRGLSEQQVIALAQARGMSREQIAKMQQRINEIKLTGGTAANQQTSGTGMTDTFGMTESIKMPVDSAVVDQRIFGFSFFNNENLTFEPNINLPVPPSYVLGPGDEILIDVWGVSQQSYNLPIDKNGSINIPNVGPVQVGGLSQEAAQKRIFSKLTSIYSDLKSSNPRTFASINVGTVKSIKVNVIGEVFLPGTYTLPGTATAFNALYLSGGPNKEGSFRNIQVIRNGELEATLDVYEFLIRGKSDINVPLSDGDVILVPTYEKRVKVGGEFKRNGIFEAKGEEKVSDLVEYAGGFTENAYTHRIELYRTTSRQRAFKDVLADSFDKILVQSGDSVFAGSVLERFENKVSIEGAVYRPGNYELTEGLTLKQLIDNADGVREDVFLNRGLVTRLMDDLTLQNITFNVGEVLRGEKDIELKREDMVTISSIDDLREIRTVEIYGEVQYPGEFDYNEDMTLSDLVFKSGGFKESASEAFIEISRRLSYEEAQKAGDKIAHVYQFTISRNLKMNGEDAKFILSPYDQVFVRQSPGYEDKSVVNVRGEVNYAGQFSLTSKKERVSTIIQRAGGLSPNAYAKGAMLTRKVEVSQKVKRLREQLVASDTSLVFDDLGFDVVSIDLEKILKHPGKKDDIFLQDGDELVIPRELQTVKVTGGVLNPLSASYIEGKSLKHYVRSGGGFSLRAKKGKSYVIYPNGAAASTKSFLFFRSYPKVMPGSEVVVPEKPQKEPLPATAWIAMASALASLSLTIVTIADRMK